MSPPANTNRRDETGGAPVRSKSPLAADAQLHVSAVGKRPVLCYSVGRRCHAAAVEGVPGSPAGNGRVTECPGAVPAQPAEGASLA